MIIWGSFVEFGIPFTTVMVTATVCSFNTRKKYLEQRGPKPPNNTSRNRTQKQWNMYIRYKRNYMQGPRTLQAYSSLANQLLD
jgi:hypothetical protein